MRVVQYFWENHSHLFTHQDLISLVNWGFENLPLHEQIDYLKGILFNKQSLQLFMSLPYQARGQLLKDWQMQSQKEFFIYTKYNVVALKDPTIDLSEIT